MSEEISEQIKGVFSARPALERMSVTSVLPLAGDASNREYFRVLCQGKPSSMIVLRYGEAKGPALSGETVPQSEALLQLSTYLEEQGVPVPKLYTYDPQHRLFFFEDLGDVALAALARGKESACAERLQEARGDGWLVSLFKEAVDVIAQYQKLPPESQSVIFRRGLAFENYRKEASEFTEYFGPSRGIRSSEVARLEQLFDAVCESLIAVPKTPVHFDFHGFNLMVDRDVRLRVIDYQDACLVSHARDLFSLVNDRDMDFILGRNRQAEIISYYLETVRPGPRFEQSYNLTALHWDLRVAGRFVKLCQTKKTDKFYEWLPGTLRRLGRTLQRMQREIHGLPDMLEIVSRLSAEAREGIADPWSFPAAPVEVAEPG